MQMQSKRNFQSRYIKLVHNLSKKKFINVASFDPKVGSKSWTDHEGEAPFGLKVRLLRQASLLTPPRTLANTSEQKLTIFGVVDRQPTRSRIRNCHWNQKMLLKFSLVIGTSEAPRSIELWAPFSLLAIVLTFQASLTRKLLPMRWDFTCFEHSH